MLCHHRPFPGTGRHGRGPQSSTLQPVNDCLLPLSSSGTSEAFLSGTPDTAAHYSGQQPPCPWDPACLNPGPWGWSTAQQGPCREQPQGSSQMHQPTDGLEMDQEPIRTCGWKENSPRFLGWGLPLLLRL